MAGDILGRTVTISIDGAVVATARTKSFTVNNEQIDVTDGSDDGIRKLLSTPGEKAVDISVDGMRLKADTALLDLSLSTDLSKEIIFDYGTYTLTGDFFMPSYGESLPYKDAVTFTASFSSAGAFAKAVTP